MDEKDITELYKTDRYINELHLDHSAQVLYWAISGEIWSMGVDGSNPIVLLQLPNNIIGFTQWNNLVYWTDNSGIHSITKDGSRNTTLVESLNIGCHYFYDRLRYNAIAIISGKKQQPGTLDLELSPTSTRLHSHVQDIYIYTLPPQAPIPVVMTMVAAVNSVSWVQWIPGDTPVQMKVPEEYVYTQLSW